MFKGSLSFLKAFLRESYSQWKKKGENPKANYRNPKGNLRKTAICINCIKKKNSKKENFFLTEYHLLLIYKVNHHGLNLLKQLVKEKLILDCLYLVKQIVSFMKYLFLVSGDGHLQCMR